VTFTQKMMVFGLNTTNHDHHSLCTVACRSEQSTDILIIYSIWAPDLAISPLRKNQKINLIMYVYFPRFDRRDFFDKTWNFPSRSEDGIPYVDSTICASYSHETASYSRETSLTFSNAIPKNTRIRLASATPKFGSEPICSRIR
jgi:hypothetical protein